MVSAQARSATLVFTQSPPNVHKKRLLWEGWFPQKGIWGEGDIHTFLSGWLRQCCFFESGGLLDSHKWKTRRKGRGESSLWKMLVPSTSGHFPTVVDIASRPWLLLLLLVFSWVSKVWFCPETLEGRSELKCSCEASRIFALFTPAAWVYTHSPFFCWWMITKSKGKVLLIQNSATPKGNREFEANALGFQMNELSQTVSRLHLTFFRKDKHPPRKAI